MKSNLISLQTTTSSLATPLPRASSSRLAGLTGLSVLAGLITLLSGCAQLASVPAGTPVTEVIQKFGKPTTTCPGKDGTQRMVWSQQPMGQAAWGATVSSAGTLSSEVQQILTDEHFNVLSTGKWTPEQVTCEFGPPANVEGVAKDNAIVWAYRYKQSGVWNSLMYVYFDSKGGHVTHFHPGFDPLYTQGGDNRR